MVKNVNCTARLQWKVDTIKDCIYLQCGVCILYLEKKMVYLVAPRFVMNSFKLLKVENLASTSCATAAAPEVLFCVAQYDEQNFLRRTN